MTEKKSDVELNRDAIKDPNQATVEFDVGFKRGNDFITTVVLRKPQTGSLRGLNLTDVLQGEVNSIIKLAPRISTPAMTEADVITLEAQDILKLGLEIMGFFADKEKKSLIASMT